MSQAIQNVIVIGAGGNLGPPLLRALSTSFNLSVLSRASSKATFDSSVKVHKIADEYPLSELVSILKGQDAVITLLRAGATELIKRCIDASVQAGVKRFIPGEFGSNSGSAAAREAVPIFEKKWEVKNYLVEKEREGLSWTSVVCGSFFDWGITAKFLGFDLSARTATIYDEGTALCKLTNLSDVSQAVKSILLDPEATVNRYVYISTFYVNQKQILTALEKATGSEWQKNRMTASDLRKMGYEKIEKGNAQEGGEDVLVAAHWSEIEGMDYEKEESWNERLGLPRRDLDDVVTKVVNGSDV